MSADAGHSSFDAGVEGKGLITEITGFLLRSEVLRRPPELLVEAYGRRSSSQGENGTEDSIRLLCLRKDYLAEDVLFVLFEGDIQILDFSSAPKSSSLDQAKK